MVLGENVPEVLRRIADELAELEAETCAGNGSAGDGRRRRIDPLFRGDTKTKSAVLPSRIPYDFRTAGIELA